MPKTITFWWCITAVSFMIVSFYLGYGSLIEKKGFLLRKVRNPKHARFLKYFSVVLLTIACYIQFFIESFEAIVNKFNVGFAFVLTVGMVVVLLLVFTMLYTAGEDVKKIEYEKSFKYERRK